MMTVSFHDNATVDKMQGLIGVAIRKCSKGVSYLDDLAVLCEDKKSPLVRTETCYIPLCMHELPAVTV